MIRWRHYFQTLNCCSILLAKENSLIWLSGLQKITQQMAIVDEKIEETFKCSICAIKLKSKYYVQRHIEVAHNNIKDFDCYICAKKFWLNINLQSHIKTVHENSRNFECSICNKKFGQKAGLRRHIKVVHDNIKDFECSDCGKKFGLNINLQRKIKTIHKTAKILNAAFAIKNLDRRVFFCSI